MRQEQKLRKEIVTKTEDGGAFDTEEVADKDLKFTTAEEYINNALDYDSGAEDGSEEEKCPLGSLC